MGYPPIKAVDSNHYADLRTFEVYIFENGLVVQLFLRRLWRTTYGTLVTQRKGTLSTSLC
jgi:hypothetical protein